MPFTYRLYLKDASDVGEAAYAQMNLPGWRDHRRQQRTVPGRRLGRVRRGGWVAVRRTATGWDCMSRRCAVLLAALIAVAVSSTGAADRDGW